MTGMIRGMRFQPQPWLYAFAIFIGLSLINSLLFYHYLWAWLIDIFFLAYFAYPLEAKRNWGAKKFLIFSASVQMTTSLILSVWILIFTPSHSVVKGFTALHKAYLLAWALSLGRQKLMYLNVEARSLRWLLLIFCIFEALLLPIGYGLAGLVGFLVAWILLEDLWKEKNRIKTWREAQNDWNYLKYRWKHRR